MIDRTVSDWYRDAIIYQLHIKSFFDSDDDGVGDFEGVTRKLDYIKDLGVTAVWLLPFYPSPLRDDGYDIADYRDVNPAYGRMRDFRRFVKEAHARDLRVITELVINHTSDQHPWFQRARRAKPGSAARDFYVWSDTDRRYADARIIFVDTEPSNWAWDPVAQAYYWHRFFSHQPDLNFDNPRVLDAVLDVMRFWLSMGVDGLRLDAIPYLIERDGTNCENLPETHVILKKIRAALDAEFPDRMLLAEANQWPEDTATYFGDGDECHMAFHFPLMPRMYMGVAQEDRHPITDIMRQTPEIPEGSQWAIFLRNHDELTLEMVTDQERDYLWTFYAGDTRARINLGIRRRLAPLLGNDRRKIELLNSLLLSMPGTPVLYYGDEIGMGDNIYLGDRDGVRTPMQWSPDRNGGFSRADPAKLFLPAIQDPIYGFDAVNVEAQYRSASSLLHWLRTLLAVRRNSTAFGRGTLRFLYPANRKVLAYLREHGDDRILCVANLSHAPQPVELDLAEFAGMTPTEMTGGSAFPRIGELPYLLTLPAYGFYWFRLEPMTADESRFGPRPMPELFTLVMRHTVDSVLSGRERIAFERNAAPPFVAEQRWFAGRGRKLRAVAVADVGVMRDASGRDTYPLALVRVSAAGLPDQGYFLPLAVEAEEREALLPYAVARVRRGARVGLLLDATASPDFATAVLGALQRGDRIATQEGGEIRFTAAAGLEAATAGDGEVDLAPRRIGGEQSNSSIAYGNRLMLKLYRRLQPGVHPEVEVGRFLTEIAGFANAPAHYGAVEHVAADGETTALAVMQAYTVNQGDAWTWSLDALKPLLEAAALAPADQPEALPEGSPARGFLHHIATLGRRSAEMHAAFAAPTDDPDFGSVPFDADHLTAIRDDAVAQAERAFAALDAAARNAGGRTLEAIEALRARRDDCLGLLRGGAGAMPAGLAIRVHGDYHLGQVLIARDDVMIVDFEGEPSRPVAERRAKWSPLRDVAGMLRSFAYLADTATRDVAARFTEATSRIEAVAERARALTIETFLAGYEPVARERGIWIEDDAARHRLLRLHLLAKALYEVAYEADHRPDWIETPIRGVLSLLDEERET